MFINSAANKKATSNKSPPYYWPKAATESSKLGSREEDWNLVSGLVASRTRGGGTGRPSNLMLDTFNNQVSYCRDYEEADAMYGVSSDDSDYEDEDDDVDEVLVLKDPKPDATNVIVEVAALTESIEKNCRCKECNGPVEASTNTICIATSFMIACKDAMCGWVYHSNPPAAAVVPALDKRERSTDYAMNVLYVLGFIACGDGGREAARVLGMLGLPNDTTMESRSFGIIEDRVSRKLKQLTVDILNENLKEEVRLTIDASAEHTDNDFHLWQEAIAGRLDVLYSYPKLSVSFDMGWQQRSSGVRYNSPSGHALLVGKYTRKPITVSIKSKKCTACEVYKKKANGAFGPVNEHVCYRNHEGSSGAMEPAACLDQVVDLFNNRYCIVANIVCDDDASTRSLLKWSNADYMKNNKTTVPPKIPISRGKNKGKLQPRPDKGKLPANIPEPKFLADPNHRRKVLSGELIALSAMKVADKATMTRMDVTRITKNFGYMIRALPAMKEEDYFAAGKAVLEHHFDNHKYCGAWCAQMKLTEAQRLAKAHYYRDKTLDAKLYDKLNGIVERFITVDRLAEVAHGMDTQVNESFNNTISWFAPKNKVYCGTSSLTNRIGMAIGINSLGLDVFFTRLFKTFGIDMTPNVRHFMQVKERKRLRRLLKIKERETKKLRMKRKFEQYANDVIIAKLERSKRDGSYAAGQHMKDIDDDEEEDPDNPAPRKKRSHGPVVCPHCGKKGHKTTKSSRCLLYVVPETAAIIPDNDDDTDAMKDAAEDLMNYESIVFEQDAGSSGDDEGIIRSTI
jgi:hypothetical protein